MVSKRWIAALASGILTTSLVVKVAAQQSSFRWGFNDWKGTILPQCQPLAIFVDETGGTVKPVPPYYLVAYESSGISTVSAVGNHVGALSWTVNHLIGTQLVLTMFDANGNSGGVLTDIYTIAGSKTGANASCIPSPTTPPITVTSNATSKINTCDVVQLSISGGMKPYTVSIAETNAEAPFNNSMGPEDNIYSWVDNLSPGNQIIISVFDHAGNYGQSTPLLTLSGSTDPHCTITSSSFNNSNNGSKGGKGGGTGSGDDGDDGQGNHSSSKTGIIAGVVIAAFFAIFFGLIAWFFLRRRKQTKNGVREGRNGWTIDRSDSVKYGGGRRSRLPSEPSESDVTPFTLPPQTQQADPNVHGYSEVSTHAAGPFTQASSPSSRGGRETYYRDDDERETDGQDAYAMDAFRLSTVGSSSGSGTHARSSGYLQGSQSSRNLRVVNEDGEVGNVPGERTKASMVSSGGTAPPRAVFQHQDAGLADLEEIPPAYPGPSTNFPGQHQ